MDRQIVVDRTRKWLSTIVIGLELCPFAQRVFDGERIRYVVSEARDDKALLTDLQSELTRLAAAPITDIETTLLIHPHVFADFLDFNDFLDPAERLLARLRLRGVIQLATFHPHYQFADATPDDVENYTNRSPYPMLHLLREESVSQVAGEPDALLEIPQRNVAKLREIGKEKLLEMLKQINESNPA